MYNYLVRNNYSFKKKLNSTELYHSLISSKLSEPLSTTYFNTLKDLADKLRCELISKGEISTRFLDGIVLRHKNNTSYNTTRRHLNVLVSYLYDNGFPIHKSKLKTRKQEEVLHKPISDVSGVLELVKSYNNNLHICCLLMDVYNDLSNYQTQVCRAAYAISPWSKMRDSTDDRFEVVVEKEKIK